MTNEKDINAFLKFKEINNRSKKEDISPITILQYKRELIQLSKQIGKSFKKATEEDLLQRLVDKKQRTKNWRIALYKDFYRWLFDLDPNEKLPNCVRRLHIKRVEIDHVKYRKRVLNENEYKILIEFSKDFQYKAVIEALRYMGGRSSEVKNLNYNDVKYDGKRTTFTIRKSKSTPHDRIFDDRATYILDWKKTFHPCKNYKNKDDVPLFVTTYNSEKPIRIGKNYIADTIDRIVKRIRKTYPNFKDKISPHDFRHTSITKSIDEDINPKYVAQQHGITPKQLEQYMHNQSEDYIKYLDKRKKKHKPTYQQLEKETNKNEILEKKLAQLTKELKETKYILNDNREHFLEIKKLKKELQEEKGFRLIREAFNIDTIKEQLKLFKECKTEKEFEEKRAELYKDWASKPESKELTIKYAKIRATEWQEIKKGLK